jgi:poly-gamma-glutamate system protein
MDLKMKPGNRLPAGALVGIGLGSLVFGVFLRFIPPAAPRGADAEADHAVRLMARAIEAFREYRAASGPPIDSVYDINRTGLIGIENSPITTSLGKLEGKRTVTNPQFAGAVVRMFREAGVRRGDMVAVGASSSFPGLILATLAAADALGLKPLLLSSLGASNWGGNNPGWTWLEMSDCLRQKGLLDIQPIALSIGGDGDAGRDMKEEGREFLRRKIEQTGRPFIREPDLVSTVAARISILEKSAGGVPIKVFVNVGGSYADMGTDGEILKLRPGFNPASEVFVPPVERRGLIQEMARRGIPVIHLLFVKGLCARYGLPWDPMPLPGPDPKAPTSGPGSLSLLELIAFGVYLTGMIFGLARIVRKNRRLGT